MGEVRDGLGSHVAVDIATIRVVLPPLGREVRGQLARRGTLLADARIDVKK
jgi:ribosome recycling factor